MESNEFLEIENYSSTFCKYLTVAEAAGLVGLSIMQIIRLTEKGELQPALFDGSNIMYEKEVLMKWALEAINDTSNIAQQTAD